MKVKGTRCASVFAILVSLAMGGAYFLLSQVYILVFALSQIEQKNILMDIGLWSVLIFGGIAIGLAVAIIVLSVLALIKVKKNSYFENSKTICKLLKLFLLIEVPVNIVIAIPVVLVLGLNIIEASHVLFALFYFLCYLKVNKDYKYNLRNAQEVVPVNNSEVTEAQASTESLETNTEM